MQTEAYLFLFFFLQENPNATAGDTKIKVTADKNKPAKKGCC